MKNNSLRSNCTLTLKRSWFIQIIFLGLALLLVGCEKEKDLTKGSLTGFVRTIDKYAQFCDDMSGVKVTIVNSTGYTNSEGKYQIDNIPVGTHTLRYSKEGYSSDTCKITITPGDIPVFNPVMIFLSEKPDVKITSMDISVAKDSLILKGNLSQSYSVARFFVFVDNTPDVSYDNYDLEGSDFYWWIYWDGAYGSLSGMVYNGNFEKNIIISDIKSYILSNSTYVAIYIANPFYSNVSGLVSAWPVTQVHLPN